MKSGSPPSWLACLHQQHSRRMLRPAIHLWEMPRLSLHRRGRPEQDRTAAQRNRRTQMWKRRRVQLFRSKQKLPLQLERGCLSGLHQRSKTDNSRHKEVIFRHQGRDRGAEFVVLSEAIRKRRPGAVAPHAGYCSVHSDRSFRREMIQRVRACRCRMNGEPKQPVGS